MPHLQLLISFSAVAALELKSFSLRRVRLSADDSCQGHHIDIGFNSDSRVLENNFKTSHFIGRMEQLHLPIAFSLRICRVL